MNEYHEVDDEDDESGLQVSTEVCIKSPGPFFRKEPRIWRLMGAMNPSLGTVPAFEAQCLGNTMALSEILA